MATSLPKPSRPSLGPPAGLSVAKTRRPVGGLPTPSHSMPNTPRTTALRTPSSTFTTTTTLPQPKTVSNLSAPAKTLRKTGSINSFPQPPRGDSRVTSLSGSSQTPMSPISLGHTRKAKKTSSSSSAIFCGTASLLNGTGEGKSVARSERDSDGLLSISSPPHSRSSSAQGSYSTSATQYDDIVEGTQQKLEAAGSRRSSKSDAKGNVIVSVRVRPDVGRRESKTDSGGEWIIDSRRSLVAYRGKEGGNYFYDNVFATNDDNAKVYDCMAKRLVRRVMEGYHGTVFAYGMTGTGKTFSMQGTASSPGVIPLAITDIFSYIRETPSREFLLRVSYLEIYNEKIHDLLSMPTGTTIGGNVQQEEIKLREDGKRGVYATPLKEEIVQSPTQLLRVIARGDQARRTASTQFNARSSRSHAVVQIVVESRERAPSGGSDTENKRSAMIPGGVRVSTLSLIDLAGSEKAAESRERRTEGSHINKSLLTLGTVIARLSENKDKDGKGGGNDKDARHLPYRDSKLTRLLQGALSGNSLVSILCTIHISSGAGGGANTHAVETLNTLKFASRAKNSIVSHAKKAEEAFGTGADGSAHALLERYRTEITELRAQLEAQARDKSSGDDKEDAMRDEAQERAREKEAEARHEEQMLEMQLARTALKERIDHLNRLILSSKSIGVNASGAYSSLGFHPRHSLSSARSSMATSVSGRPILQRSGSMTSTSSTICRRTSRMSRAGSARRSSGPEPTILDDEESVGEYGDGIASLAAQNRALQADLVDKNQYIQTLERRLLHARRTSHSRTSVCLASGNKGMIMVGEDHSVAALLSEKDAEISELRAQLEDKDKMLAALRCAARARDNAGRIDLRTEVRSAAAAMAAVAAATNETTTGRRSSSEDSGSPPSSLVPQLSHLKPRTKSVDEMSRILDEMIQDRVETGQLIRGARGSVRVAPSDGYLIESSPVSSNQPPIQLQLLSRQRNPLRNDFNPVVLEA